MTTPADRPDALTAFLRARLDEDERVAHAATPGPWTDFGKRPYGVEQLGYDDGHMVAEIVACGEHDDRQAADAVHIARHDPARVLAEVDAKRDILDLHQRGGTYGPLDRRGYCAACGSGEPYEYPTDWPCETLKLIALPYAEHPNYQEEWRP